MALQFNSNYPTIVCLGDSQTQYANLPGGFVAALADTYQRKADVINRGFHGYTTRDVLPIIPDFLSPTSTSSPSNVVALTLWLGCNDSINEGQKQYVSPEDYERNLHGILDVLRARTSSQSKNELEQTATPYILVIGPTPVGPDRPFHSNERKELYTSIGKRVVDDRKDAKVGFLDAYRLFLDHDEGAEKLLDVDGLHISPAGYQVLSQAFKKALAAQPGLDPDTMKSIYPDWKTF